MPRPLSTLLALTAIVLSVLSVEIGAGIAIALSYMNEFLYMWAMRDTDNA